MVVKYTYMIYRAVEVIRKYGGTIYTVYTVAEVIRKYGGTIYKVYRAVEVIRNYGGKIYVYDIQSCLNYTEVWRYNIYGIQSC